MELRRNLLFRFGGAAAILMATASFIACGSGGATSRATTNGTAVAATAPTAASVPEAIVEISDNAFTPATITIQPGTKVIWKWSGSNPHIVLISGDRSPEMTGSGSFEKVFRGGSTTINYQCAIHGEAMSGKIVVQ